MELTCRPARPGDGDAVETLRGHAREAVEGQRGGAALLAEIDGASAVGQTMVWCAAIDDLIVGYVRAILQRDGSTTVFIREVWVEPEAREVGAGEALVSAALAWAIAEGASAIDAWALPGSRELKNLFERMGLTARLLTVRRELG